MITTEKNKKIGIQGYEGSYHQMAAEKFYSQPIELQECATFRQLTTSMRSCLCDEAIMAIENSIAGSILPNYNLIIEAGLHIVGEVYLPIRHQFMTLTGASLNQIKEIHSHPMALLQCSKFLNNLPGVKIIETEDTAFSARLIAENKINHVAAIASKRAAEIYDLEILSSDIEDDKNNFTRFLILSRSHKNIAGRNKASLNFTLNHQPGSLNAALAEVARHGLNISKLQSVPIIGSPGHYAFHIDVEFEDEKLYDKMITDLTDICLKFHILGIYQKGELC